MEWQPIETAPRDGTEVILGTKLRWNKLSLDSDESRIGTGFYCAGAFWYIPNARIWRNRLGQHTTQPTHWMPLPKNPARIYNIGGTVTSEVDYSLDGLLEIKCPRGKKVDKLCACGCGRNFLARAADVKRGWGKFATKRCKAIYQEKMAGQMANYLIRQSNGIAAHSYGDYDPSDSEYWDSKDF